MDDLLKSDLAWRSKLKDLLTVTNYVAFWSNAVVCSIASIRSCTMPQADWWQNLLWIWWGSVAVHCTWVCKKCGLTSNSGALSDLLSSHCLASLGIAHNCLYCRGSSKLVVINPRPQPQQLFIANQPCSKATMLAHLPCISICLSLLRTWQVANALWQGQLSLLSMRVVQNTCWYLCGIITDESLLWSIRHCSKASPCIQKMWAVTSKTMPNNFALRTHKMECSLVATPRIIEITIIEYGMCCICQKKHALPYQNK